MVFIFVQNTTSIFLLRIQSSLSDTPGSQTEPFHTALTPLSPFHYSSQVGTIVTLIPQCFLRPFNFLLISYNPHRHPLPLLSSYPKIHFLSSIISFLYHFSKLRLYYGIITIFQIYLYFIP